jgi:hypothetical protein
MYLQEVKDYSALAAGLRVTPLLLEGARARA